MEDFGISENLYENLFNKKLYSKDIFSFLFPTEYANLSFDLQYIISQINHKDKN